MKRTSARWLTLGRLEQEVLEVMWRAGDASVREMMRRLPRKRAYTTIMTTLDRLHTKGLLARAKEGNAFRYRVALSRDDFHRRVAEETVSSLLARSADPVLAGFVDAAAAIDEGNLVRLERLIAERRRTRK
jgi:predicted transcriptional regulator